MSYVVVVLPNTRAADGCASSFVSRLVT